MYLSRVFPPTRPSSESFSRGGIAELAVRFEQGPDSARAEVRARGRCIPQKGEFSPVVGLRYGCERLRGYAKRATATDLGKTPEEQAIYRAYFDDRLS